MNEVEKNIEAGKAIIRKEGITFQLFKSVIDALLVKPKFDEENWIWFYECYAEGRSGYKESIEEWASEHFSDFTIEKHGTELRKKEWIDAKYKPKYNIGVLVFIPDEDNHITSGMWDVSDKWVLLDEYRTPECEVTHWMQKPALPNGKIKPPPKKEIDSTKDLLSDIISWEKDLSEYNSLEAILRDKYKIVKKSK